jgi:alpha-galactosidase
MTSDHTRIVVVGAGSYVFGSAMLRDLFVARDALAGAVIALVDIDPAGLDVMTSLANRMNAELGAPFVIESHTDRRQALPGASFVLVSIAVRRNELWRLDWEIPLRHGARQVLGENGGPGGLFHSMRNAPIILSIARDVEDLAPDALMINFTNPEGRVCRVIDQHTSLRFIGLCHEIDGFRRRAADALGLPKDRIDPTAIGLNHFTWVMALRDGLTGEDLYPRFRAAARERLAELEAAHGHGLKLTAYLADRLGYWPASTDDHVGEYLGFAWELAGLDGYPFDRVDSEAAQWRADLVAIAMGQAPIAPWLLEPSGERAVPIIEAILSNAHAYELAVNIRNDGLIPNLPPDAVVEVPVTVDANGVHGVPSGPLPEAIAALCRTQLSITDRAVEAGVKGDRAAALEALLLDPVITSTSQAEAILAEMLEAHRPYLPQFFGGTP